MDLDLVIQKQIGKQKLMERSKRTSMRMEIQNERPKQKEILKQKENGKLRQKTKVILRMKGILKMKGIQIVI